MASMESGVAARAAEWWARPEDGVLWVQIRGAAPDGRPLLVGTCYLPPKFGNGQPEAQERWWARLAEDWDAAAALGHPLLTGDFIAHTATRLDWDPGGPALPFVERLGVPEQWGGRPGGQPQSLCF